MEKYVQIEIKLHFVTHKTTRIQKMGTQKISVSLFQFLNSKKALPLPDNYNFLYFFFPSYCFDITLCSDRNSNAIALFPAI